MSGGEEQVKKIEGLSDYLRESRYFPRDIEGQIPLDDGTHNLLMWLGDNIVPVIKRGIKERGKEPRAYHKIHYTEKQAGFVGTALYNYASAIEPLHADRESGKRNEFQQGYISGIKTMLDHLDLMGERHVIQYLFKKASSVSGAIPVSKITEGSPK